MRDAGRRFATLDALRAVAAVSVVLSHLRLWFPEARMFDHAYLAVDLFFVLSGFVLSHSYEHALREGLSRSAFLAIRAIRLYPLILLAACLGLIYATLRGAEPLRSVVAWFPLAVTSIPIPTGAGAAGQFFPLNWPAWSLFFELVVSAAFAGGAYRLSTAHTALAAAVTGVGLAVCAIILGQVTVHRGVMFVVPGLFRAAFPFLLGMVIWRLWAVQRLPRLPVPALVICVMAIATFLVPLQRGTWNAAYDLLCVGLVFPALVAAGARVAGNGAVAPMARVGRDLSYPVYILHFPLMSLFVLAARAAGAPPRYSGPLYVVSALALVVAASYLAFRLWDRPVRRALMRRLAESRVAHATDTALLTRASHPGLTERAET